MNGLDDIGLTLQKADHIDSFEARRSSTFPWLDGPRYSRLKAEVRISTAKSSNFYTRVAKGFLGGLPASDERPERPPAAQLILSATGNAIERAVRVAQDLKEEGEAEIIRIRTQTVSGSNQGQVPQLLITMKGKAKAHAVVVAGKADPKDKGSNGKNGTDW